jgi:hypothetical protein
VCGRRTYRSLTDSFTRRSRGVAPRRKTVRRSASALSAKGFSTTCCLDRQRRPDTGVDVNIHLTKCLRRVLIGRRMTLDSRTLIRHLDDPSMTGMRPIRNAVIERVLIGAFAVIAATSSYGGLPSVEIYSVGPAEGIFPGTVEAWVHVEHAMSVDCSPPRACYAKSQWIHAYVSCPTGSLAILQRISMDLNGNVVAIANAEQLLFVRPIPTDASGVAALAAVCGYGNEEALDAWRERRRP